MHTRLSFPVLSCSISVLPDPLSMQLCPGVMGTDPSMVVVCCAAGLPPGVYVQEPSLTPHSLKVGASAGKPASGQRAGSCGLLACLRAGLLGRGVRIFFSCGGCGRVARAGAAAGRGRSGWEGNSVMCCEISSFRLTAGEWSVYASVVCVCGWYLGMYVGVRGAMEEEAGAAAG